MAKSHLKLVEPTAVNRTVVMPVRKPNAKLRTREYLTDAEVAQLIEAAKGHRYGHRDATMILMGYRHGFRPSELVDLRWDQIDFDTAMLAVRRVSVVLRRTHPTYTAMRCAPSAVCNGSKSQSRHSCSHRSVARPLPLQALHGL